MNDSPGRPEEEQGHDRYNISISKYVSRFLNVPNRSKFIEDLVFFDAVLSGKTHGLHFVFPGSPPGKLYNGSLWICPLEPETSTTRKRKRTGFKFRKVPEYLMQTFFNDVILGLIIDKSAEEKEKRAL